jgi:hypothetical protein
MNVLTESAIRVRGLGAMLCAVPPKDFVNIAFTRMFYLTAEERHRSDFLTIVGDSKDHLRESAHSAGNHAPRLARSLARWHEAVVQKLRIAPEPAGCAHTRSCAAVWAVLRPFKGSFAYDNGMANRHRAETSEAVVTSTLNPPRRRYGWADGIGAAAVLECPEEGDTRHLPRHFSSVTSYGR